MHKTFMSVRYSERDGQYFSHERKENVKKKEIGCIQPRIYVIFFRFASLLHKDLNVLVYAMVV